MTAFSYELGELIFDNIKNKYYYKFIFNDGKYVRVPLKRLAPNYKVPGTAINSRYCDYTIKQFMVFMRWMTKFLLCLCRILIDIEK